MANGSGGDFAGDGSVRWQVVTVDDDGERMDVRGSRMKVVEESYNGGKGRKNSGVDKHHHDDFRIILKVPEDARQRAAFLAQFRVPEKDGHIEVRLPIAKTSKQVQVRWTDSENH
jgi:hypothetical protein